MKITNRISAIAIAVVTLLPLTIEAQPWLQTTHTPPQATEVYTADTGALVGIGLTEPKSKLDVIGTVRAGGQTVPASGAGAELDYLPSPVGIGTLRVYDRVNTVYGILSLNDNITVLGGLNGLVLFGLNGPLTAANGAKVQVQGNIYANGTIIASSGISATYQDVAEWVRADEHLAPATVVVLAPDSPNQVTMSRHSYDTTVAGVVSANPGLLLGVAAATKEKIATTGRVKVRVDATTHPVKIGDLLVTSDKRGMAMVSEPLDLGGVKIHRPGTLIGKALEPLEGGEGEILVLLSLQ